MNAYVQRIVSLLKSERHIDAEFAETKGTDQRLYVQIIGLKGFPVFAIKPTGAYELPYEHTYTNASMKKMGLPILEGQSEGLNAVLFGDELAKRPGVRHDLAVGYDPIAIERVRSMAATAIADKSQMIWREPAPK
ncbi:MAG: hypothetical protein WBQ85_15260 [Candidatus Sulfotelmatobacter sp.]